MATTPKFVKYISAFDLSVNEMRIPHSFCYQYSTTIPSDVKIQIRNGYAIWLDFKKREELLKGILLFYRHFELIAGQTLLFDYVGGYNFEVCILNKEGCEIEYPRIKHPFQSGPPKQVWRLRDGGLKFVRYLTCVDTDIDEVPLPLSFMHRCGCVIPARVEFILNGGIRLSGYYFGNESKLTGLGRLCDIAGILNLNCFDLMVFTYDLGKIFTISVFDSSLTETLVLSRMCISGESSSESASGFEIVVQSCHLLPYCYGVVSIKLV